MTPYDDAKSVGFSPGDGLAQLIEDILSNPVSIKAASRFGLARLSIVNQNTRQPTMRNTASNQPRLFGPTTDFRIL